MLQNKNFDACKISPEALHDEGKTFQQAPPAPGSVSTRQHYLPPSVFLRFAFPCSASSYTLCTRVSAFASLLFASPRCPLLCFASPRFALLLFAVSSFFVLFCSCDDRERRLRCLSCFPSCVNVPLQLFDSSFCSLLVVWPGSNSFWEPSL